MLISVGQLEESVKRYESWQKGPGRPPSPRGAARRGRPAHQKVALESGRLTSEENLAKRRQMLDRVGQEPSAFAYERVIGNNDSVYSNFCELITLAKRKVGRVVMKEGSANTGFATGFMVSDRLLLTNWHVFNERENVRESEVEFFYELDIFGRPTRATVFKLAPQDFFTSCEELDYCLVAVEPMDVTGTTALATIGYHYLDASLGKLGDEEKELLNIIHHPDGDYKQLSIRENMFVKILPTTLWYTTDTAPGSSGSPVFNDQWQVVALHHMGVPSRTPDGKNYLDKDRKVIQPVDGKLDGSRIVWIANEGIRISVLLTDLFGKYPDDPYVSRLKTKPAPVLGEAVNTPQPTPPSTYQRGSTMDTTAAGTVQISFPASLVEARGAVSVSITSRSGVADGALPAPASQAQAEALLEVKKLDTENAVDYSDCRGYQADFLGKNIPFPQPKQGLQRFVAKLKGSDATILNYYHFSAMFHSVRMMPCISCINVDGNPAERQDDAQRADVWLRDNRLDYDIQLNDKFYAGSHFDKGHLSRREDADWGQTGALAKKYADMTCIYTNACPQVPALNQSKRKGLWGKLETVVLEKGVMKEEGAPSKISVFNGPIFAAADPIFKGIQIPMQFWKIILWKNAKGALKATAFKLSQSDLVGEINFEALGFDTNAEFLPYRCSIPSIEELTELDLSALSEFDTFEAANPHESLRIGTEEDLAKHVGKDSQR